MKTKYNLDKKYKDKLNYHILASCLRGNIDNIIRDTTYYTFDKMWKNKKSDNNIL